MELPTNISTGSATTDLTKLSVGAVVLFASCQLSNSTFYSESEENVMPPRTIQNIQYLSSDVGDAILGDENTYEAPSVAVSREEAIDAFSEFVDKLTTNMISAPGNVHATIAERPWDFV